MARQGRAADKFREITISTNVLKYAEGSALIRMGDTHVLCAASVEEKVPPFLKGTGQGWVTAEYAMLPRSSAVRKPREISSLRKDGRAVEIQRQVGRALRSVVDLGSLGGERTLWIDCDVIQADGGTRTASITGGFVAMFLALKRMQEIGLVQKIPLDDFLAAISVGLVDGEILLDLDYPEDSRADVDMNVVMTSRGEIVEILSTSERKPLPEAMLHEMLAIAKKAVFELIEVQKNALSLL